MDLTPYVELVRRELAVAAEAGGDEARVLADRLTAPLESTIRLTLLEALSAATSEITREIAPGSVHVRLSGRDPDFVVTLPPTERELPAEPPSTPALPGEEPELSVDRGATSRINLRLPEDVKGRVEQAAAQDRISVNAWLVRAAVAALGSGPAAGRATSPGAGLHGSSGGQSFTGWVR